METLKVIIQRNRGNYGATIDDERIGGAVVATHESYKGVWEAIRSALEFHIESCINDGDDLPEWLVNGDYELKNKQMYKGVDLPSNYNDLTLAQKEAIWLGMLLVYEEPDHFDEYYWEDEILIRSEIVIYEDEVIKLCKCYNAEYSLDNKQTGKGISSSFDFFFESKPDESNLSDMHEVLGCKMSVRDYLRYKGFPVTAEFWQ